MEKYKNNFNDSEDFQKSDSSDSEQDMCIISDNIGKNSQFPGQKHNNLGQNSNNSNIGQLQIPDDLMPYDIVDKAYSLEPDMRNGWRPNVRVIGPIPLQFESSQLDLIVKTLLFQSKTSIYDIVYLGFRPENSIKVHEQYQGNYHYKYDYFYKQSDQSHLTQFYETFYTQNNKNNRQFVGMNSRIDQNLILHFDSNYECGNLDVAIKVNEYEYDLYMRSDSNTRGHCHWYNYKVKNMKKGVTYKFNISNFTKKKCLYSRGMRPYVSSKIDSQNQKEQLWYQQGKNVKYEKQESRYTFIQKEMENPKQYFVLSFEYTCKHDDDEVQFAYCIPYQYSKLEEFLKTRIKELQNEQINIIQSTKLCETLSGIDIPLLTITDFDYTETPIEKRNLYIIQARIHPGEANGSWVMHGILEKLLNHFTDKSNQILLQMVVFKIIPMMNPDGVIMGNYRTGFGGRDLNRQYLTSNKLLYPSIEAMKSFLSEQKQKFGKIEMFIDLHGHSGKKNIFSYSPDFSMWDINYYRSRLFPKIMNDNTDFFRIYSSIFKISAGKKSTARAYLHYNFGINNCYTIESSNGSYYKDSDTQSSTVDFLSQHWIQCGHKIIESITTYEKMLPNFTQSFILQKQKLESQQLTENHVEKQQQKKSSFIKRKKSISASESEDDQNNNYLSSQNNSNINNNISTNIKSQHNNSQNNNINISSNNLSDSDQKLTVQKLPQSTKSQKNNLKIKKITQNSDVPQTIYEKVPSSTTNGKKRNSFQSKNKKTIKKNKHKQFLEDSNQNQNKKINDIDILKSSAFQNIFGDLDLASKKGHESDKFSEGGSDSESSDEDFDKNYIKNLEKNVQKNQNLANNIAKKGKAGVNKQTQQKKKKKLQIPHKIGNSMNSSKNTPQNLIQKEKSQTQLHQASNFQPKPKQCAICFKIISAQKNPSKQKNNQQFFSAQQNQSQSPEQQLDTDKFCICHKKQRQPLYVRPQTTKQIKKNNEIDSSYNRNHNNDQLHVINFQANLDSLPDNQNVRPQSANINMIKYLHKKQLLQMFPNHAQNRDEAQKKEILEKKQQQAQILNYQKEKHWSQLQNQSNQHVQNNQQLNYQIPSKKPPTFMQKIQKFNQNFVNTQQNSLQTQNQNQGAFFEDSDIIMKNFNNSQFKNSSLQEDQSQFCNLQDQNQLFGTQKQQQQGSGMLMPLQNQKQSFLSNKNLNQYQIQKTEQSQGIDSPQQQQMYQKQNVHRNQMFKKNLNTQYYSNKAKSPSLSIQTQNQNSQLYLTTNPQSQMATGNTSRRSKNRGNYTNSQTGFNNYQQQQFKNQYNQLQEQDVYVTNNNIPYGNSNRFETNLGKKRSSMRQNNNQQNNSNVNQYSSQQANSNYPNSFYNVKKHIALKKRNSQISIQQQQSGYYQNQNSTNTLNVNNMNQNIYKQQ